MFRASAAGISKICHHPPPAQVQAVAHFAAPSETPKAGAVKDEGGTFGKKGEADENAYFHKLNQEKLKKIKEEGKNICFRNFCSWDK